MSSAASAPAPDPALFGTYSPVQDLKGTVKSQAKSAAQKVTKKTKK